MPKNMGSPKQGTFIDLFSGCGGLSLGLMAAGWKGLFAVEVHPDPFKTLKHNLINGSIYKFDWPPWLPVEHMNVATLLEDYRRQLERLRGHVDLIVGGPPCQGFSIAGRRDPNDKRNELTDQYINIVQVVRPQFLLLENVAGFDMAFTVRRDDKTAQDQKIEAYSGRVRKKLEDLGYAVYTSKVCCSEIGVPQSRKRFLMLSIHHSSPVLKMLNGNNPFDILAKMIAPFRSKKGLRERGAIPVVDALGDFEVSGKLLVDCLDSAVKGFKQIKYEQPRELADYQQLMRQNSNGNSPNSLRLARHRASTQEKFKKFHQSTRRGIAVSQDVKDELGIKKYRVAVLDANLLSSTVTSVPEDILHYKEHRILTVRENARLQSFPDWYEILGKYTTGGDLRKVDCPRYTQVANAVPPLLAEVLGELILKLRTDSLGGVSHDAVQL